MDTQALIAEARQQGRSALDEAAGKRLLAAFGVAVPKALVVQDAAQAASVCATLTPPLALKVMSPDILHKSDVGGVRLDLADDAAVREAAAATLVPGRFQAVDEAPVTVIDGAHNADGMAALARSLERFAAGRRVVACVSVLDDKDAAGMLRALLPVCDEFICTSNSNPRVLPPATLASLTEQLGGPPTEIEPDPHRAVELARDLAGPEGAVLATGSIYLVADLVRPAGSTLPRSRL